MLCVPLARVGALPHPAVADSAPAEVAEATPPPNTRPPAATTTRAAIAADISVDLRFKSPLLLAIEMSGRLSRCRGTATGRPRASTPSQVPHRPPPGQPSARLA